MIIKKHPQLIAEVPDYQALQKCRTLIFNQFSVDVYGITGHAHDTEFTYLVYTEQKIKASVLPLIQAYIKGIVDTLRSF